MKSNNWSIMPNNKEIEKTISSLKANGVDCILAFSKEDAVQKALEIIPKKSEVFTMTSVTLDSLGISKKINDSGEYISVRKIINDGKKSDKEINQLGATPDFAIGSLHALTQDGKLIIASYTGSQLPAYVYGAKKVIFMVGIQKIVKNLEDGINRIYEYALPLESERAKKAYGVSGSEVNKILIINKEFTPNRIMIIFVPEKIGF